MYAIGTRVVIDHERVGVVEMASEDDRAYHIRLQSGTVIEMEKKRVIATSELMVCPGCGRSTGVIYNRSSCPVCVGFDD